MRRRTLHLTVLIAILPALLWPLAAHAVSCTMHGEMTQANRSLYEQAARSLGMEIQAGNTAAVRAATIAQVAAQFDPIAATIQQIAPEIRNATLTVDALYNLNAADLTPGTPQAQFFCGASTSSRVITVTIPHLPPGNYMLVVLHATGVAQPQQMSLILQNDPAGSAQWKLAGLYVRPLTMGGHDGLWFWKQARDFAAKKENWDAYFYYQEAELLLNPSNFISSPNLQKLQQEMQAAKPADLPGANPLVLKADGKNLQVTAVRTQDFGGNLDLAVDYKAQGVSDPVATRTQIVALMKALLALHPGLQAGFHGLWVYAYNNNGQPFAIELPMNQIH